MPKAAKPQGSQPRRKKKQSVPHLLPKHLRFIKEYLIDLNATQAAIRTGYSKKTAYSQGQRLLKKAEIAARIAQGRAELAKKAEITAEKIIAELARTAFLDIRELFDEQGKLKPLSAWPEDAARAVAGIEQEVRWEGRGEEAQSYTVVKTKVWDKLQALQLLGKHLGLFVDRHELTGKNGGPIQLDLSQYTTEELASLRTLLAKVSTKVPS